VFNEETLGEQKASRQQAAAEQHANAVRLGGDQRSVHRRTLQREKYQV
jgi:hypothetical protein